MSRSTAPYGMLLDRGLTLDQLDLAYDIAVSDPDPKTNRRRLTMGLRDIVSEQEAEGKTKKCLTRAWLNPPQEAAEMIAWARELTLPRSARPVLHFGALLATFPFVGHVARIIGQHLQTEGSVEASVARVDARRALGDRSSVEVATRKVYTTLRNLELLCQTGQTLSSSTKVAAAVEPVLIPWLSHALLLTRQVDSLPLATIRAAPEMLGVELTGTPSRTYPFLEVHAQAFDSVLVRRARF